MSEQGCFIEDAEMDMKVLRSKAKEAVRFFNNPSSRKYVGGPYSRFKFSVIENGKLSDNDNPQRCNYIMRSLVYIDEGEGAGRVILYYSDHDQQKQKVGYPGMWGYGGPIITDVISVKIVEPYLVIYGFDGLNEISYSYLILDSLENPVAKPKQKAMKNPISKVEPKKRAAKKVASRPVNRIPTKNKPKSKPTTVRKKKV